MFLVHDEICVATTCVLKSFARLNSVRIPSKKFVGVDQFLSNLFCLHHRVLLMRRPDFLRWGLRGAFGVLFPSALHLEIFSCELLRSPKPKFVSIIHTPIRIGGG